jgi:hypothetical protein
MSSENVLTLNKHDTVYTCHVYKFTLQNDNLRDFNHFVN